MIDNKDALKAIDKTTKKAGDANLSFGNLAKGAAVVGAAVLTAGTAMLGLAMRTADTASAISDASKKVGMSAESYQKWTYAAKMSGIEADKLETLMKKQQTVFADAKSGSKKAGDAYRKLGIDITKLGSSSEAFDVVIAKLADMEDETARNEIANDLFGKSYADLIPMLKEGGDGIDALRKKAEDLGLVMSDESVDAGEKFGDTIDTLKLAFSKLVDKIGTALIPTFQKIADWIITHQDDIVKFANDVIGGLTNSIKWFLDNKESIGRALAFLLGAFLGLKVIGIINGLMAIFNTLLLTNPISWVVLAIAGLVLALAGLIIYWDDIAKAVKNAYDWWVKFLGLDKSSAQSRGGATLGTGSNPTGGSNTQTGYSHHALGGIFTKPTFFPSGDLVGEAGAEAVLPLSKLPGLLGLDKQMSPSDFAYAIKSALSGMRIEMGEDGFASFVDYRIVKAVT